MILTFILNAASAFFTGLVFATSGISTLPSGIGSAISYAVNAINSLNYLIPTDQLFLALEFVLAYEAAIWTFKGSVWIYRHIPFIGH